MDAPHIAYLSQEFPVTMSRTCVVNLGLYRTGTSTLAAAVSRCLDCSVHRSFPDDLRAEQLRGMLVEPETTVREWWSDNQGEEQFMELVKSNGVVCDGWIALMVFLTHAELEAVVRASDNRHGISVQFVVTTRDVEATVKSELHHWVIHDLESKAGLAFQDRSKLEVMLRARWHAHSSRVDSFLKYCALRQKMSITVTLLPLEKLKSWSTSLAPVLGMDEVSVRGAIEAAGVQNRTPPLPI